MNLPRLGVFAVYLSQKKLEELTYFKRLSQRGRALGLEVHVFTAEDVNTEREQVHSLVYDSRSSRWVRRWSPLPELIYDRCRYQGPVKYHEVKAFRNKFPKLIYLGRPLANKWSIYQYLLEHAAIKPHLPSTQKYYGVADTIKFLKKHRLVYLKPRNGTGGRGIQRVEQLQSGLYYLQGRNANRVIQTPRRLTEAQLTARLGELGLTEQYLVQQGIDVTLPDGRVHDFRLLIQKNGSGKWEVTGCAGRIGAPRSVTSNLHGGGSAETTDRLLARRFASTNQIEEIKHTMNQLSFDVAEHLEKKYGSLCELGIDLAVDRSGRVWLLEVNPKPSREVFRKIGEKATYARAVSRPLEYAKWLLSKREQRLSE